MQEHKYFEDAFKVYERGVKIFKYPHVKDIWVTYLSKFVKRYGKSKLERARELFEHAVEMVCFFYPFDCSLVILVAWLFWFSSNLCVVYIAELCLNLLLELIISFLGKI